MALNNTQKLAIRDAIVAILPVASGDYDPVDEATELMIMARNAIQAMPGSVQAIALVDPADVPDKIGGEVTAVKVDLEVYVIFRDNNGTLEWGIR